MTTLAALTHVFHVPLCVACPLQSLFSMPDHTRQEPEGPAASGSTNLRTARRAAAPLAALSEYEHCVQEASAFAAELFALFSREPTADRADLAFRALRVVRHVALHEVLEGAVLLARSRYADQAPADLGDPVSKLERGTWAFVRAGARMPPRLPLPR